MQCHDMLSLKLIMNVLYHSVEDHLVLIDTKVLQIFKRIKILDFKFRIENSDDFPQFTICDRSKFSLLIFNHVSQSPTKLSSFSQIIKFHKLKTCNLH